MCCDPGNVGAAPPDPRADRKLFTDVIVRDGDKVTIHLDRLTGDADQAVEIAGVISHRLIGSASGSAKAFWGVLNDHIRSAHDEVKARRAAGDSGTPPSTPPPSA